MGTSCDGSGVAVYDTALGGAAGLGAHAVAADDDQLLRGGLGGTGRPADPLRPVGGEQVALRERARCGDRRHRARWRRS